MVFRLQLQVLVPLQTKPSRVRWTTSACCRNRVKARQKKEGERGRERQRQVKMQHVRQLQHAGAFWSRPSTLLYSTCPHWTGAFCGTRMPSNSSPSLNTAHSFLPYHLHLSGSFQSFHFSAKSSFHFSAVMYICCILWRGSSHCGPS